MLTQIQRQIRRHPTAGVVVTLVLWWTVTSFIAFFLRSNSDSGVSEEFIHLGHGGEEVVSLRHRETARRRKVSRKTSHNEEKKRSTRRHSSLQAIEKPKDTANNLHTEKELRSEHKNLEAYVIPTELRKRYQFVDKQKFNQESLLNLNVKNSSENGGSFEGSRRHLLSNAVATDSDSNGSSAVSHDSTRKDDVLIKYVKHYLEKGNLEQIFDKTFVATLCESSQSSHSYHINISSQMDRMKIMLKSLVFFSKSSFKVILVTDTQDIYDLVLNQLKDWPARYRSRLLFQRAVAWSPHFESNFQEEWRSPCQWSKLFLVESLPHEQDVVIYIDQSTVFVAPAEYMWKAHMGPLDQKRAGYSSVVAENDAPIVMNLTTLRAFIGPHGNFTLTALHFSNTRPKLDGRETIKMLLMDYPEMFQVLGGCWRRDLGSCYHGEDDASIDLFQDRDINSDTRHVNITFQILYEIFLRIDLNASAAPFTPILQQALLRLKSETFSSSSPSSSRPPKLTPALLNSTSHFDV